MVFSSVTFLFFFLPVFILLYWVTPQRFKNLTALIASLGFYMWGAPIFVFFLLGSVLIDFLLVKQMAKEEGRKRKRLLWLSLLLNVGLLVYFKYTNFFLENTNSFFLSMGLNSIEWTKIALPIGISFFTFQKLSYVIDVYRKTHEPLQKISDFCLYICLFPQLIAGPIVRYNEIADQLKDRSAADNIDNKLAGLFRFSVGLAQKMLIANQMGSISNYVYSLPIEELGMGQVWFGTLCYAFQIYFDFSGYSNMAIGLGLMMGFRFPENFNFPYIAQSISEFWRRWHITLGRWMRDYLYIPLGGNKVATKTRLYFNLWAVFLISGLWHGASWNFVIWGAFHGLFLILDRLFLLKIYKQIGKLPSILITFIISLVGWVFFKAATLPHALALLGIMFDFTEVNLGISTVEGTYPYYLPAKVKLVLFIAFFFSFYGAWPLLEKKANAFLQPLESLWGKTIKAGISYALLALCLIEVFSSGFNPFIYFRF